MSISRRVGKIYFFTKDIFLGKKEKKDSGPFLEEKNGNRFSMVVSWLR